MSNENERARRFRQSAAAKPEINLKAVAGAAIAVIAIIIKLLPGSSLNTATEQILKTSSDFPQMFSEVTEVIKKHTLGNGKYTPPVTGEITSPFGERKDPVTGTAAKHLGIDISAPMNTPVLSAFEGKVLRAETNEYYGNFVMVEHPTGIVTLYGHLSSISVNPGDRISSGHPLGYSGDSGRTTGPHLHFEVRKDGVHLDPVPYMQ